MKFATVAAAFFAAKALAAPAPAPGYAYDVVDVTVTKYATVQANGYNNGYNNGYAPQTTPCPEEQKPKPYKPAYHKPQPQPYQQPAPVVVVKTVYGNGYGNGNGYGYTAPQPYKPKPRPHKSKPKPHKPKPYTPPSSYNAPSTGNSMADQIVARHNMYRAKHSAPPLTWDDSLASYASTNIYPPAQQQCVMQHTPGGQYGENLAFGYGSLDAAVDAWYNEINSYDFNNPGFSGATGHFTAMVWKSTTHIGCALDTSCNYLKCEYKVPGNVLDMNGGGTYFRQNVLQY